MTTDPAARPRTGYLVNPVMEMAGGMIVAQLVNVAAHLRLADLLCDGPRTGAELAAATGAHEPSLRRVLSGLACHGLLDEVEPGRWVLTPLGRPLRSDSGDQTRSLAMMACHDSQWQAWGNLLHTVMTGEPGLDHAFGVNSFEYYAKHPDVAVEFHETMSQNSRRLLEPILAAYPFGDAGTVVDVGGGDGTLLCAILEAHPATRGVLLDTEHGVAGAAAAADRAGVADRVTVVAGDFFTAVPPGGDLYLLKDIVHDWDEDPAARLLRRCIEAAGPGARIVLVEQMMPTTVDDTDVRARATVLGDLTMLVSTGGRERTEAEFAELLSRCGAVLTRTVAVPETNYHVVEGVVCG